MLNGAKHTEVAVLFRVWCFDADLSVYVQAVLTLERAKFSGLLTKKHYFTY